MNYDIALSSSFKQSVKRLEKRFPHVKEDVRLIIQILSQNPKLGVVIPGGSGVRKLRVKNSDLEKGKSGGYRLLYHIQQLPVPTIYLLLIYPKSDRQDVTRQELQQLLKGMAIDDEPTSWGIFQVKSSEFVQAWP